MEPPTWAGHIPFAFWIVEAVRPSVLVELGTYSGNSYCAFCQAVERLGLNTLCFAVDTWRGDPHTGFYNEEVYRQLAAYHDQRYAAFSRLVRSTFDAARDEFEDGSIDLLHIDGYHTYENVRHDFEMWLPKLSDRAVVLLHDTTAIQNDFGTHRYWGELSARYPSFQFIHSYGLGVLGVGRDLPERVRWLLECSADAERAAFIRRFFARLGTTLVERWESVEAARRLEESRRQMEELRQDQANLERQFQRLSEQYEEAQRRIAEWQAKEETWRRQSAEFENVRNTLVGTREHLEAAKNHIRSLQKEMERTKAEAEARLQRERQEHLARLGEVEERYCELLEQQEETHQQELATALRERRAEIEELRSSFSWRVTAPARWMLDQWLLLAATGRKLGIQFYLALKRLSPSWRRQLRILTDSPLLDERYYEERYPDVRSSGMTAAEHFLCFGAAERRDPHPLFNTGYYLDRYCGGSPGRLNPLVDFLTNGARLGRRPHPLFVTSYYVDHTRGIAPEGENPLVHFLGTKAAEGRRPHPLFDPAYYAKTLRASLGPSGNALVHYCENATRVSLPTHPLFEPDYYRIQAPQPGPIDPLQHYEVHGRRQQLEPNSYGLRPVSEEVCEVLEKIPMPEEADATEIEFACCAHPEVSIVIAAHNGVRWTLRCLRGIRAHTRGIDYEVIVVDDGSTDETQAVLSQVPGLRYVRCRERLGYLKAVNKGAAEARGSYIALLNNDTLPLQGWLNELRDTFDRFPTAGLVGGKLIYPDGRLQEAGAILWQDGSGWNYGRLDEPQKPEYSYLRPADYCSAASIMVRADWWRKLQGFDEEFSPAYFEDADLAFRLRRLGADVLYQPLARVVHFGNVSYGNGPESEGAACMAVNRLKFVRRWGPVISKHGVPETHLREAIGRYRNGRVLVVDACTPTPDRDSGSNDTLTYLKALVSAGFHVSFAPAHNMLYFGRYTEQLQRMGVECLYRPFVNSVREYLSSEGRDLDLVLLFREPVASETLPWVKQFAPQAKRIFHAIDLHFLREERWAELSGNRKDKERAAARKERELQVIRDVDHTILLSEYELDLLRNEAPEARVSVIPPGRALSPPKAGWDSRKDIVFAGGFRHPPNEDAVRYFAERIWPLIAGETPEARFRIVGAEAASVVGDLAGSGCEIVGHVPEMEKILSESRLTVAPLRWGAGVNGKVVTSLCHGVPCVATPLAVQGLGLADGGGVRIAETPEEFARAVIEVYNSPAVWERLSSEGYRIAEDRFSETAAIESVHRLLEAEGVGRGSKSVLSRGGT